MDRYGNGKSPGPRSNKTESTYHVDLIKPEPGSVMMSENRQFSGDGDLMATEIKNLQWPVSVPKFDRIVIGEGGPGMMVVPDPMVFTVHKLWLSNQTNRETIQKKRDRSQALAVYRLILQYLPEF